MNERKKLDLVEGYLARLERALRDAPEVPGEARRDLLEDVRSHIDEAWESLPEKSRTALLNIMERLGDPERLASEERERLSLVEPASAPGAGPLEIAAVVLTVLFWPIGVLLAWLSPCWRTRDKLIATALPLLGLLLLLSTTMAARTSFSAQPVVVVEQTVPADGSASPAPATPVSPSAPTPSEPNAAVQVLGIALALYGLLGAPFTAAVYLAWRLRRRSGSGAAPLALGAALLAFLALLMVFLAPFARVIVR